MEVRDMTFSDYCCLNRSRFDVDPLQDGVLYFGNQSVQESIVDRIKTDVDVSGVPKFGVVGRFGAGKTHTLFHLKHWFESPDSPFNFLTFYLKVSPYSEDDPKTRGWPYIHRKILDAMGEQFLRDLVRETNRMPGESNLSDVIQEQFQGDANLKQSLAEVLTTFFLREMKDTSEAWNWLKGEGVCHGTTKKLDTSSDMIHVLLNLGRLARLALKKGIVLLLDETQALDEVKKASATQIHDSFLQLADGENTDVGFIIANMGTAGRIIPRVLLQPTDIISRLGASERTLFKVFIDLKNVIRTKNDLRNFANQILGSLIDEAKAKSLINKYDLATKVSPNKLPFTEDALDRITETLFQHEDSRSPRIIIKTLARLASAAYQYAKSENAYTVADRTFIEPHLRDS